MFNIHNIFKAIMRISNIQKVETEDINLHKFAENNTNVDVHTLLLKL